MRILTGLQKHPALSHLSVAGILLDLALLCWAAHAEQMGWVQFLFGLAFSYLSFRLILIFTSPRSLYKVITALIAFAYFIYRLIA